MELEPHTTALRPRDRAPLLNFWGDDLVTVVASMVTARPSWGGRLLLAPREVQHAIAAYLRHRLLMGEGVAEAYTLAVTVDSQHARDLLREAVPDAHARLYGLLARCGPRAQDLATYRSINALLHGPLGGALLERHLVVASTVALAERVLADPVLAACAGAVMEDQRALAGLEVALALLRGHGLAHDIEALPHGSGWRAVVTRIAADLGRAECPPAPFNSPQGWHQPRYWSEIRAIGRHAENCLASPLACISYFEPWLAGRWVILCRHCGPGIITVQSAGGGVWWISEMSLGTSRDLGEAFRAEEGLRAALVNTVAEAGGVLVESDPWAGMGSLLAHPTP